MPVHAPQAPATAGTPIAIDHPQDRHVAPASEEMCASLAADLAAHG